MVGVNPVFRHIEGDERGPLCGEVLFVGQAAGIANPP